MQVTCDCANCGLDARSRRREFTEQTWSVLLAWNEVSRAAVDQPICDDCYEELREILIDRANEVELAISQPEVFAARAAAAQKNKQRPAQVISVAAEKKKRAVATASAKKTAAKKTAAKKTAAKKTAAKKTAAKKTAAKKTAAKKTAAKKTAAKKTKRSARLAS